MSIPLWVAPSLIKLSKKVILGCSRMGAGDSYFEFLSWLSFIIDYVYKGKPNLSCQMLILVSVFTTATRNQTRANGLILPVPRWCVTGLQGTISFLEFPRFQEPSTGSKRLSAELVNDRTLVISFSVTWTQPRGILKDCPVQSPLRPYRERWSLLVIDVGWPNPLLAAPTLV